MESMDTDRPDSLRAELARYDRRASLERIDAMRSRPRVPMQSSDRPVVPWLLTAALLAFSLGLIANPWFERNVRSQIPGFAEDGPAPSLAAFEAQRAEHARLAARVAALEARPNVALSTVAAEATMDSERMMRAETRIDDLVTAQAASSSRLDEVASEVAALGVRVDATAAEARATLATATQGAAAAQDVLLLTSVRRALEAGARLGPLEPLLQREFAARYPQPVAAIAQLSAAPVTPARLGRELAALRPALTGAASPAGGAGSWWEQIEAGLAGVVQIRPSAAQPAAPDPAARVDAALRLLAQGDVGGAAAQIEALPAARRQAASTWTANARRWLTGMRGLATLEAAALLTPETVAAVKPVTSR